MTLAGMADALDSLYLRLAEHGPDLRDGFTNHAPMVVEALVARGEAEAARRWLDGQGHRLTPRPPTREPITPARFDAALGQADRFADWAAFMRDEIAWLGWQTALGGACARLAPGFAAAATHGWLRTAHAARAVAARPTPARVAELADGLALWASTYQALPIDPAGSARRAAGPHDPLAPVLAAIPRAPAELRQSGSITAALARVAEHGQIGPVFAWFEPGPRPREAGWSLARAFARLFLDQARDPSTAIVFTHAITSTAAILWLEPVLRPSTLTSLLRHAWHTSAGLVAAYAKTPITAPDPTPEAPEVILAEAIAHADDHVVKLSTACLGLLEATGDPIFAQVPARARACC